MDDLVKRLLAIAGGKYGSTANLRNSVKEAADRIEQLEAALRKIDRSACLHPNDIVEIARRALTGIDGEGL